MKIKDVYAFEVLDSRGNPTIKTVIKLNDNSLHSGIAPSGASTGKYEAHELRDNKKRYFGLGVETAVNNIKAIILPYAINRNVADYNSIEKDILALDNESKSKIGANTVLSFSMALSRAAAHEFNMELWKFLRVFYFENKTIPQKFPRLMVNIVNGGKHANWGFDIQEFMIIPAVSRPKNSVNLASEIFHELGNYLKKSSLSTLVGDEGGYSPLLSSNEEVFDLIIKAAKNLNYQNSTDYSLAVDCASSEFFENGKYVLKKENSEKTASELKKYYLNLQNKFKIHSFEDPFAEDDWVAFTDFTKNARKLSFETVGDDLYVTNVNRIQKGAVEKATTTVLIKPNQIGSVSETVNAIKVAKKANLKIVVSHRSGETEDSFISDLAFACDADYLKAGSTSRTDRVCKYNRFLEIENSIINT